MLRNCLRTIIAALFILAIAWPGLSQAPQNIVTAKMLLATEAVHSGSLARAAVVAEISQGYHINDHHPTLPYLIPTSVKFVPEKQFTIERISYPKGKLQKFVFAENGLSVYQDRLVIPAGLQTASGVKPGDYTLKGQVNYQACNASACFPPASAAFELLIHVAGPSVALKPANSAVFGKRGSE